MAEEVSIKMGEFNSNIESLQSAVSNMDGGVDVKWDLEKTNIKPFTKDLKTAMKAVKVLKEYKQLLDTDVDSLHHVGREMEENDETIAQATESQEMKG